MRVAFVADDLYPGFGGQAAATEGHIEALLARGHEVRVLAGDEKSSAEPPAGVHVSRLPAWRPGEKQTQLALPRRRAVEELAAWADVLQANTPTPLALRALRAARRAGVPAVMGFHTQEESMTLHFDRLRPLVSRALRAWYTFLYRQPDCLVAPSPFAARLAASYTPRPVHVVSNGIRIPRDDTRSHGRTAALRERLLDGRRFLLVHVGRLSQEKRPRDLLEISAALAVRRRDFRLAVAGTGPLRRTLEQRRSELRLQDMVSFLGYVPEAEKHDLLAAGDLFLMPSPTELQSIATLEAMARRCAVAALRSASSAVCELVREAGCGLCYKEGDTGGTAREIDGLLDDLDQLRQMQDNAGRAARAHDVHESGRQLEEIYASLLRSTPPRKARNPNERKTLDS